MSEQEAPAARALADHLVSCRRVDAALIVDGSADAIVAALLADGWEYLDEEVAGGKRVRYLRPPEGEAAQ